MLKYRLPGVYYREEGDPMDNLITMLIQEQPVDRMMFNEYIQQKTRASKVEGDFERGFDLWFERGEDYTWFILKFK